MSEKSAGSNFKIMIVDDSFEARQFLKLIITNKFNLPVIEAENGQAALTLVYSENPSLILLDVMMPIMDGFEFLKIIRADERSAKIPVIICSALSEKKTVVSFFEEGITDYMIKPLNLSVVYSKIDRIIKKSLSRFIEFRINGDGIAVSSFEPTDKDIFIKFRTVEGSSDDDVYILKIGDDDPRTAARISDKSIIKIPKHDKPLKLEVKFAYTKNKPVTFFYDVLE